MNEFPVFTPAIPEIFMLIMACVVMIVDVYSKSPKKNVGYFLTLLTLVVTAYLSWRLVGQAPTITFHGGFIADRLAATLKFFMCIVLFIVFIYSRRYMLERDVPLGEFYGLGLLALLGMMVMVSANNMIAIYLGLELLSLPMYAMVAMRRGSGRSAEAALKYFVMGAIASAMLLYGMSMIYGIAASLDLPVIAKAIAATKLSSNPVLIFGLVFLVVGLGFKFGAVPFHMWVPDVYEGAPTAVTAFVSTAPKIAAFGLMLRLLLEGLPSLQVEWQQMLIILAVVSLFVGNLLAIAQSNIKRMLAYSTISHIGFVLLAFAAGTKDGYAASMFYVIVYAIMSAGGFGFIMLLSRKGFEAEQISDLKGLNHKNAWLAFIMLLFMASMAGIPPLLGFDAKLLVLTALIQGGHVGLAIYALIMSVVGAFYYIRIIKVMYFEEPEGEEGRLSLHSSSQLIVSLNGLALLVLGIFPAGLIHLATLSFS
ncbi:NADH-quinone oxidoreductase subunit NuoN [Piscirickettsia litoralis]|uniref:NADH-quinone oxidoreductase subunit N n=1 Tax=Piscirickettsia litoralis TaxID=1891921 RepID=A0ABX3A3S3_9GAMM|nr:NADH-quinone oxidoreductase subunit NuoN [Piscirickettsia litoralis]ODN42892.1 NADH-quinone oxidoreductase subunit N [Piscirickettsia litoralis]